MKRWKPVIVVRYDPSWPGVDETLRQRLAGTPETSLQSAIERLATLGYVHKGDLGII